MKDEKQKAVIFDIDNTILNLQPIFQEIHKLGLKGSKKWQYFYDNCNSDRVKPIKGMLELYRVLRYSPKQVSCILLSARSEKVREQTIGKLMDEQILYDRLYMRKINDFRPAEDVKRDYLVELMEEFNVIAFFDDELSNCKMAKDLGIASLRVV